MKNSLRIVTKVPLEELWQEDGADTKVRGRSLGAHDIADILRIGPAEFVIADVGLPLRWIKVGDCYSFWKDEVKPHLAGPGQTVVLDEFPDSYCYFASQWESVGRSVAIVLEPQH